jgi:hypothetical protein
VLKFLTGDPGKEKPDQAKESNQGDFVLLLLDQEAIIFFNRRIEKQAVR